MMMKLQYKTVQPIRCIYVQLEYVYTFVNIMYTLLSPQLDHGNYVNQY